MMSLAVKLKRFTSSMQTASNHTLSCIADTTKIGFQIFKQIIVAGGHFSTLYRIVLLYEARVANSLLGNHRLLDWTAVLDSWLDAWSFREIRCPRAPHW